MADTATTTNNDQSGQQAQGATSTAQGMFVQPQTQTAQQQSADAAQSGQQAAQQAAGNQQESPKPAPPPSKPTTGQQATKDNDGDKDEDKDDKGKGSKDAVLADLARERDERQQVQSQLTAVLEALGINQDKNTDPETLATDLQAQRAENAVLRAGQGIADTEALLDSRRFTDSLTNLDVTDAAKVKAHIEQFVQDNPRYAPDGQQQTTPGVRDAAATTTATSTETDWLRAAIKA